MNSYSVSWTIDIEADSPEDAARQALGIHRDSNSTATVFDVQDADGTTTVIDLDEDEDEGRCECGAPIDYGQCIDPSRH